jgi:hypothetical protein
MDDRVLVVGFVLGVGVDDRAPLRSPTRHDDLSVGGVGNGRGIA